MCHSTLLVNFVPVTHSKPGLGSGNISARNDPECRARANTDGRQQKPGSYMEKFAPTCKFSIIRTICAIAARKNLTLYQFDIKCAFLIAKCKEPVYMILQGRYRLHNGRALRCIKLLYGLKQSAYGFHELIGGWLKDH